MRRSTGQAVTHQATGKGVVPRRGGSGSAYPFGYRVGIAIASAGRPELLAQTLPAIRAQDYPDIAYTLVVPDRSSAPDDMPQGWKLVISDRGLTRQRNAALRDLHETDIVFFFDDDAIPRSDYVSKVVRHFEDYPESVAVTGLVLHDGAATSDPIPWDIAVTSLNSFSGLPSVRTDAVLYGCNFAVRTAVTSSAQFDERLPLYGWLEDLDFSESVRRFGSVDQVLDAAVVHLGVKSGGRAQHRRLGYVQVVNPIYLGFRKEVRLRHVLPNLLKPIIANLIGSLWGTDKEWRRRRLHGNTIGLNHLVRGHLSPERMLEIEE